MRMTFFVYKKKMLKVDSGLYKLGVPSKCASFISSMILIVICFSLAVTLVIDTLSWFISSMGVPIGFYVGFFYSYVSNMDIFILFDFITCVRSVNVRFEKLNDLLEVFATDCFQTKENKNTARVLLPVIPLRSSTCMQRQANFRTLQRPSRTEDQWEHIEKNSWRLRMIKMVHLDLCQASNLLLKAFIAQVALQIRWIVVAITLTLYLVYNNIARSSFNAQSVTLNAWALAATIIHFGQLFFLSQACEHACRETEKTFAIVHACYQSSNDTLTKDEIRQFALQMSHCQQVCTKRYFSELNYSLLSECVGSITTYLVITIQMNDSFQSTSSSAMINNSITDSHNDP